MHGIVKFYNAKDAVGIITASDGKDYFFQKESLVGSNGNVPLIYCGDKVSFSLVEGGLVGKYIVKDKTLKILEKDTLHTTVLNNRREI